MSCSFFSEDSHCGPAPGKEDITIVPVKSCANNIFDHLSALGVSGKTQSGNTQIGEAEVLFNRGGLIAPSQKQVDELTVCPRHRYLLTNGWPGRKRLTCFHPDHLGKRTKQNNARRVNLEMSRSIYFLENHSVPLGAAFDSLEDMVSTLKAAKAVTSNWEKEAKQQLSDAKRYLKADFRLHVSKDERCADHCTMYALSDPNDPPFKGTCSHVHDIRCDACRGH
ncbi:unnamed protein product [Porites lobata]|uniref:Uncharacterized protein n=1 Tax=Porites lobata TaxID=104759 RepID=A0ABN8SEQ3_9CNID|nr:unnamed protein product [Porites lobata]